MMSEEKKVAFVKRIQRTVGFPVVTLTESEVYIDKDCPYDSRGRYCGNWCPLFNVESIYTKFHIELQCAGVTYCIESEDVIDKT